MHVDSRIVNHPHDVCYRLVELDLRSFQPRVRKVTAQLLERLAVVISQLDGSDAALAHRDQDAPEP